MCRAERRQSAYRQGHKPESADVHRDGIADKSTIRKSSQPDVSVVVVNYNTAHLLGRMFAALEAGRGNLKLQVIVVDNASRDNSMEVLRAHHPSAK